MDMGIVNPSTSVTYDDIDKDQLKIFDDAIMYTSPEAPQKLIELADKILALTASLLYALVYLHDRVERLVIYLLH